MRRYYSWDEEFEPGFTELYLIRHLNDGTLDKAAWADILSFPVTMNGYEAINDLIENLKQMRDHMQDILDPSVKSEYNVYRKHSNMGLVRTGSRIANSGTRLIKRKSKRSRKVQESV